MPVGTADRNPLNGAHPAARVAAGSPAPRGPWVRAAALRIALRVAPSATGGPAGAMANGRR